MHSIDIKILTIVIRYKILYHYEKKVETVMVVNSTNINKTNNHLSSVV